MLSDEQRAAWQAKRAEEEARQAKQTEALATLGFGPAFFAGGGTFGGGQYFATCQTCGVSCVLLSDPEAMPPVAIHKAWHDKGER